jgi:hypothetical protein
MKGLKGWLWLLVALVWLLLEVGVVVGSASVHNWIAILAVAVIGIIELKGT